MSGGTDRRDEAYAFAAVGVTWVLGTMALIGPVALLVALVTMACILVSGFDERVSLLTSSVGVGLGSLLWGFEGWLVDPINTMVAIYRDYLFDGRRFDIDGLRALFLAMLVNGPAWPHFAPLGMVAGGLYATCWQVVTGSPLRRTTRVMSRKKVTSGIIARLAKRRVNDADACVGDSTLLGVDKHTRKRVTLSDADANKHTRPGMAITVIVLAALLAGSRLLATPIVLYPISPSLPETPYVRTMDAIEVGSIVAFPTPDVARRYQHQRGQELPADFLFMKPIAAGPEDHVCNSAAHGLAINGVWRAKTIAFDQDGQALPIWNACRRLDDQEYFMLSDHVPNSFDSRYFGPVQRAGILATYRPLY